MKAAGHLRHRHATGSDDDYTTLQFRPSPEDWNDFLLVLPYCDWAYATDARDVTLAHSGDE